MRVLSVLLLPLLISCTHCTNSCSEQDRIGIAKKEIQQLTTLLRVHQVRTGSLPSEEEGLRVLLKVSGTPSPDEGGSAVGPSLKPSCALSVGAIQDQPLLRRKDDLVDPWGIPYSYVLLSGDSFRVSSAGPDRRFHTEDDVGPTHSSTSLRTDQTPPPAGR